ncbi:hypothetical protein GGS26DRAFT_595903 [Hypomontagnella submonticulosa]|nr:hypothetical protein GGS26DRAFT_595903 [Hypomontagnella submonticulosa]
MSNNNIKGGSPSLPLPMDIPVDDVLVKKESSHHPPNVVGDIAKVTRIKLVGRWAQYRAHVGATTRGDRVEGRRRPQQQHGRQQTPPPSPRRLRPRPPRLVIIYQDGVFGRLVSIYDKRTREYVYHHGRDAHKPIRMTFLRGRIEALQNASTDKLIYKNGVTHKVRW